MRPADTAAPTIEPLVHECKRADGSIAARITRRGDGVKMLAAERVLIADLPLRGAAVRGARSRLGQWFWRGPLAPRGETDRTEADVLARIGAALERRPAWGVRVYRSAAGLRMIATHALLAPSDPPARELLAELGLDAQAAVAAAEYRCTLCATPKQVGAAPPPASFPFADRAQAASYEAWEQRYDSACTKYAHCHVLKRIGVETTVPETATIVELHDKVTRAGSTLRLL